jgi:hypothetical protein
MLAEVKAGSNPFSTKPHEIRAIAASGAKFLYFALAAMLDAAFGIQRILLSAFISETLI